jgi:hypothetical protein
MGSPVSSLDYSSFADSYFRNLGDEYWGPKVIDGLPVMMSGISNARIMEASKQGVQSFLEDPRGRQYIELQKARDPNKSDQTLAEEYLYERGLAFKQSKAQQISGWDPNPKTPPPPFSGTDNTQYTANTARMPSKEVKNTYGFDPTKVEDPKDIYDIFDFDESGKLSTDLKDRPGLKAMTDFTRSAKETRMRAFVDPEYKAKRGDYKFQEKYARSAKQAKTLADKVRKTNPDLSDAQALYAYSQAYAGLEHTAYQKLLFSAGPQDASSPKSVVNRTIVDDISGRELMSGITGTKKDKKVLNDLSDVFDGLFDGLVLSNDEKTRDKDNIVITSAIPAQGMFEASIYDYKKGKQNKFWISMNNEEKAKVHLLKEATKLAESGGLGSSVVKDASGREFIVSTYLTPDEDNNYSFSTVLSTKDKEPYDNFLDQKSGKPTSRMDLGAYQEVVKYILLNTQ